MPIAGLTPMVDSFLIKVRVTFKPDRFRTYTNDRGEGKVGSVEVLGACGGEIQITMFNEQVEKFWDMFEKGKVYEISGGRVKTVNQRWTRCDN